MTLLDEVFEYRLYGSHHYCLLCWVVNVLLVTILILIPVLPYQLLILQINLHQKILRNDSLVRQLKHVFQFFLPVIFLFRILIRWLLTNQLEIPVFLLVLVLLLSLVFFLLVSFVFGSLFLLVSSSCSFDLCLICSLRVWLLFLALILFLLVGIEVLTDGLDATFGKWKRWCCQWSVVQEDLLQFFCADCLRELCDSCVGQTDHL